MISQQLLEKTLPSDEDAEQAIIGGTILYNEAGESAFQLLVPSDFYNPNNRVFFRAMKELHEEGSDIDPIMIASRLKQQGVDPANFGGTSAITSLTLGVPHFDSLDRYIKKVKDHSVARRMIQLCNSVTNDLLRGTDPVEDILEIGESTLLSLSNRIHAEDDGSIDKGFFDLSDITPTLEKQFDNYHVGIATGCPSGMAELDELLEGGGFQPGGVYMVSASEKTGKTSLALDWAYHSAVVQGFTVPIVTMEMSKESLAKRLYSAHTAIPYFMFRPGLYDSPTDNVYTRAKEGLKDFAKFPIKIADKLFGVPEIARNLRRCCEMALKAGKPVKFAIIDYLQLIESPENMSRSTREREVSGISRALKKLAAELEIALIVMSSLNRENLGEGQEPSARNLRDSGALSFDAEALILLHNPLFIPGKPYEARSITDITMILALQRNGPTGRVPLKFIGPYMQFMTESQFRKQWKGKDLPQSMGQAITEEQESDLLWGTKEREEDPVEWD